MHRAPEGANSLTIYKLLLPLVKTQYSSRDKVAFMMDLKKLTFRNTLELRVFSKIKDSTIHMFPREKKTYDHIH